LVRWRFGFRLPVLAGNALSCAFISDARGWDGGVGFAGAFAFVCLCFLGTCFRVGLLARRYARQQSLSLLLQRK
jgi:hypothetical protein